MIRLRRAADLFAACGSRWRGDQVLADLNNLGKPGRRAAAAFVGPAPSPTGSARSRLLRPRVLRPEVIGQQLHIGERTVETHVARVYAKFNVHTRRDLVRALARTGLDTYP